MDATERQKRKNNSMLKLIVLFLHIAISKSHNNMNHFEGTPVHLAIINLTQWAYSVTTNQEGMYACTVTAHKNK